MRDRYRKTESKKQRSELINEIEATTKIHRKSVIRALGRRRNFDGGKPNFGRPKLYSKACQELLIKLYRASEFVCSDKLKHMIPTLLTQWKRPIEDVTVVEELLKMSASSYDRYLKKYRGLERRKRNSGTRPGSRIYRQLVPLKALGNIAPLPGFIQADTVVHCGDRLQGDFANSLTITDEKCGWTINEAFMGKTYKRVLPAIQRLHEGLPFDVISFNVDNGTEFLNHHIIEYFTQFSIKNGIQFPMTRSRAYKKNDNCHVEQKNWTTVRQLFGYDRIDDEELIPLMNEIYRVQNLISNFFIPQFKLKSKVRVGAKIKKTYHPPKTPYERLLEDPTFPEERKQKLREQFETLNYFDLIQERETKLAHFIQRQKELKLLRGDQSTGSLSTASR